MYLYNGIHHTTPYQQWTLNMCSLSLSISCVFLNHYIHCIILLVSSDVFGLRYEMNAKSRQFNDVLRVESVDTETCLMVIIMQYTHTCICTLGQTVYLLYIIRVNLYLGIKSTSLMYLVFTNQKPVRLWTETGTHSHTTYTTHYSLLNPQNMWYATVFRYFFFLFIFFLLSFLLFRFLFTHVFIHRI